MEVHCFPCIIIGSTFHRTMGIDATCSPGGETVADFKRLLRRTFHLKRDVASHIKPGSSSSPGNPPAASSTSAPWRTPPR
jgi:hypothetical protein